MANGRAGRAPRAREILGSPKVSPTDMLPDGASFIAQKGRPVVSYHCTTFLFCNCFHFPKIGRCNNRRGTLLSLILLDGYHITSKLESSDHFLFFSAVFFLARESLLSSFADCTTCCQACTEQCKACERDGRVEFLVMPLSFVVYTTS